MKSNPPTARRKFANVSEEMGYLYDKLVYWLYHRQEARRSRRFADRLERVLSKAGPDAESIFASECRSLVHEAKGNLARAIEHRENEIRLIRRLHQISQNSASADFIFRQYSYADLSDRLDLLAVLYHDSGDLDKALSALLESKRLCEKHRVKFDGEDILQEYLEEKRTSQAEPASPRRNGKR
jgi:tetratricopeptide (TPR) repeat protein